MLVIVLFVGIGLSINAEIEQRATDNKRVDIALKRAVKLFESQITERLAFYSYGLKSIDSLISAVGSKNFDHKMMLSFARSRNFQSEFPGVRGFGVIQNVPANMLESFVSDIKRNRPDNVFNIKHLSDNHEHLFIIRDILPENTNASAIGLNIGSEASRRAAAIDSARRNDITISAPITLVQADKSIKQGFLILLPFFNTENNAGSSAFTIENTWGWSYAPIVIEEVAQSTDIIDDTVIFSISNIDEKGNTPFYQSRALKEQDGKHRFQYDVSVFGKIWRFDGQSSEAFVQKTKQPPYAALNKYLIYTFLAVITLFCIRLVILKRLDSKLHIAELSIAKEQALQKTNKELESLVISRTKAIKESVIFQKAILESSTYSIMSTDEHGLITMFNPAAAKLLGYDPSEIIGKETPEKFHLYEEIVERTKILNEEDNIDIEAGFGVFIHEAKHTQRDESFWTYVHRDGTHIQVRLMLTCLYNDAGDTIGFLGIAYDLTEQLLNEKIIKQEKEKAERATLAKSKFLANMSHEIRTPLNGVQGALQIMQGKALNNELSGLVNIALGSIKTLSLLINDILDISMVEEGKIQLSIHPFRIDELLEMVQLEFKKSAEKKGIELHFENRLKYQTWLGDDLRIKQILVNLISNAIKFTKEGHVNVRVNYSPHKELMFSVSDTGIGMQTSGLKLLYDRFEQADQSITRNYGGSGLGMSITKSLIDLMDGKIQVASKINEGTTFDVYLPIEPLDENIENKDEAAQDELDFSSFSILVAEDNEINQIIIDNMLQDLGAKVVLVENGQEAIDQAMDAEFDLVLLDIQMPVLDGIQACIQIKKAFPSIPVIALTANVFAEDIEKYKISGFDSFMGKPYEKNDLVRLIKSYLV
jgi:PAS domain S-box-containing protein